MHGKNNDTEFVKILGQQIIEPILNESISGDSSKLVNIQDNKKIRGSQCTLCEKTFSADRYLKAHTSKIHEKDNDKKRKQTKINTFKDIITKNNDKEVKEDVLSPEPKKSKEDIPKQTKKCEDIINKNEETMDIDSNENKSSNPTLWNLNNVKPLPTACKPHLDEDDKLLVVPGDGACGPNCASAHIYGDPAGGQKLRRQMNAHIAEKENSMSKKLNFHTADRLESMANP